MRLIDPILRELEREGPSTVRVLERVPQEHFDWKPHEKSTPLGKLAWHVANVARVITERVQSDAFDVTQRAVPYHGPASELVPRFRQNLVETIQILSVFDDERIMQEFPMVNGDRVLQTMSKLDFLRMVALNHIYHHRGQLSVYLRMLDIAVPSVYGPSADESPF